MWINWIEEWCIRTVIKVFRWRTIKRFAVAKEEQMPRTKKSAAKSNGGPRGVHGRKQIIGNLNHILKARLRWRKFLD